jgi:hypothetical protein
MTVKAQWFLEDLVGDEDAGDGEPATVAELGQRFDLRGGVELVERLAGLVNAESELFNAGETCAIRDAPDTCCSACPVSQADAGSRLGQLCQVGRAQEATITALAVRGSHGADAHP